MFDDVLLLSLLALQGEADGKARHRALLSELGGRIGRWREEEWFDFLEKAHEYEVLGHVIDGALMLHSTGDITIPRPVIMQMTADLDEMEARGAGISAAAQEVVRHLRAKGLQPVLMKGPSIAMHYPQPLHRQSGDIDLFLPEEDFEKAVPSGALRCSDGSIQYTWKSPVGEFAVEHHKKLFDCKEQFGNVSEPESPEWKLFMVSAHILKHCLGCGVGLKQILDYVVLRDLVSKDKNATQRFRDAVRKAGLTGWNDLLDDFAANPFDSGNALRKRLISPRTAPASRMATALSFIKTIPFGMRYARKEWFYTVFSLMGN